MLTEDYRVRLDAFEGPLDLLLFLIRKDEVDVHDIPIASITEQYLRFLEQLGGVAGAKIDIDVAGEFLVMAATLMEIKSRLLVPTPAPARGGEGSAVGEDPRAELVRQLLEYKKFRDAAESLERRGEEWRRRFPVGGAAVDAQAALAAAAEKEIDLGDVELIDLIEAFRRVAETVNFDRLGEHQVTYDDTPIEAYAEDILQQLGSREGGPEMEFVTLFNGKSRGEMIGMFLAVLELVKLRRLSVRQDRADGRIFVRLPEENAPAPGPEAGGAGA